MSSSNSNSGDHNSNNNNKAAADPLPPATSSDKSDAASAIKQQQKSPLIKKPFWEERNEGEETASLKKREGGSAGGVGGSGSSSSAATKKEAAASTTTTTSNAFLDRLAQMDPQKITAKQQSMEASPPHHTSTPSGATSSPRRGGGDGTSEPTTKQTSTSTAASGNEGGHHKEDATAAASGAKKAAQSPSESIVRRSWHRVSDLTGNAVPAPLNPSQTRKEQKSEVIRDERKKLLVFRNVGMDLDRAILSRDIFLIPKYFRLGIDFAVDNELERMLRFFNEHAINEMKIIYEGKLLRGPLDRLVKVTGGHSLLLPKMDQLTPLHRLIAQSNSNTKGESSTATPNAQYNHKYGDPTLHTALHGGSFKKPTVVLLSQLGQRLGGEADRQWRAAVADALQQNSSKSGTGIKRSIIGSVPSPLSTKKPAQAAAAPSSNTPIQFLSVRSLDVQSYKWVHRLYVRRYVQSLPLHQPGSSSSSAPTTTSEDSNNKSPPSSSSTAAPTTTGGSAQPWSVPDTTFIGSNVFAPFFASPFCLRNYLLPTLLLVDHTGKVRWMSGGLPDAAEKASLPRLLGELELEYFKSKRE